MAGQPLRYTLNGTEFAPFFEGTEDPTHAYFRRAEPRVAVGARLRPAAGLAGAPGATALARTRAALARPAAGPLSLAGGGLAAAVAAFGALALRLLLGLGSGAAPGAVRRAPADDADEVLDEVGGGLLRPGQGDVRLGASTRVR